MPPKRARPKVLLFDLGGVVVRWTGIEELSKLSGRSIVCVKSELSASKIFQQYERGYGHADMFLRELARIFDLNHTLPELKTLWNQWVGAPYEAVTDVITALKADYITACLSNTNAMHWTHLGRYLDCETLFHKAYASHIIHSAKPNPDCYQAVLNDLQVTPKDVWFFDDTTENVMAAQAMGITSIKVDPAEGVVPVLKKFGLVA